MNARHTVQRYLFAHTTRNRVAQQGNHAHAITQASKTMSNSSALCRPSREIDARERDADADDEADADDDATEQRRKETTSLVQTARRVRLAVFSCLFSVLFVVLLFEAMLPAPHRRTSANLLASFQKAMSTPHNVRLAAWSLVFVSFSVVFCCFGAQYSVFSAGEQHRNRAAASDAARRKARASFSVDERRGRRRVCFQVRFALFTTPVVFLQTSRSGGESLENLKADNERLRVQLAAEALKNDALQLALNESKNLVESGASDEAASRPANLVSMCVVANANAHQSTIRARFTSFSTLFGNTRAKPALSTNCWPWRPTF